MAEQSLLNVGFSGDEGNEGIRKLLGKEAPNQEQSPSILSRTDNTESFKVVLPSPGYCLKTKTSENEKFFINICTSDEVKRADDLSDEELVRLLDSEDPSGFRVPMSIGDPHAELDKSGVGCTAVDVIIHPDFYRKTLSSAVHEGFFLTVVLEGVETKYQIQLSREWVKLKNKKCMGTLQTQHVRTRSKPFIMEMDNKPMSNNEAPKKSVDVKPNAPEPEFVIVKEPVEGHPDFLVAEILLPKVTSAAGIELDVGEDRILLQTRAQVYFLDVFVPFSLVTDQVVADFNRKTKVLTVTMPVEPRVESAS